MTVGALAMVAVPLIIFALYSLWRVEGFQIVHRYGFGNYRQALGGFFVRSLATSLVIGVSTAVASCLVAFGLAWAVRFRLTRSRNLVLLTVVAASTGSYVARIYSWRSILGDAGLINRGLEWLGVIHEPLAFLIFNRGAVIVALTNLFVPYAFLPIYVNLLSIDPDVLAAGRVLGAGPLTNFRRVVLPMASVGLVVSFMYVLIFATGDFAIPLFLGGPTGVPASRAIESQFSDSFNWPLGAAMSFMYMAALGLVAGALALYAARRSRRLAS